VAAVCDNDESALRLAAEKFPRATVYQKFGGLLAAGGVDAIVSAAPPQVHREVAREALERGVHVFVEKPPTVTTEALVELASIAERARLVTGVGHNLRHATASRQLQRRIAEPSFGRPICMDMRYFASKPLGDRWGLNSVLRSFLLSHANHALDLMVFQMGAARSVSAVASSGPRGSMALASQIGFDSGAVGNLLVTTCAPHFSLSVTVVGELATIAHMDGLRALSEYGLAGDEKRWGHCWVERTLDGGYEHAGYQTELELFVNAVRGRARMQPSFDDELAVYRLIDEIERQVSASVEPVGMISS
jgi:phthalate 4,5-cis-dihydrodiol dehydrogenase